MSQHIIIVGGGVVGLSAASFLARRGAEVTVLEQHDTDGSASTGNAGHIAIGHGPLPRPGLTAKALRWMFRSTSPLHIPLRFDPQLIRWLWEFRRACGRRCHERSMDILCEHGWHAGECFRQLVEDEQLDCEYRPLGRLEVFRTQEGLQGAQEEAAMMGRHGYRVEVLDGNELRARDPAFQDDVVGATLYHDHAFANPGAFIRELANRLRERGVRMRTWTEVTELVLDGGRCRGVRLRDGETIDGDFVLLAAGAWTSRLAEGVGARIPMQPAKGYHVMLSRPEPCPRIGLVCAERFVAVTPLADGLRLAGTLELSGVNHRFMRARAEALRSGTALYLRGIEETEVQSVWCGLRPCTADGLPIIGWAPGAEGVFVATGHAMMGFALGPLAGRIASECILDGAPSVDIDALSPQRFGGTRRRSTRESGAISRAQRALLTNR